MVEFQPSKLVAWVRFPSLAPIKNERTLCPLVFYCVLCRWGGEVRFENAEHSRVQSGAKRLTAVGNRFPSLA